MDNCVTWRPTKSTAAWAGFFLVLIVLSIVAIEIENRFDPRGSRKNVKSKNEDDDDMGNSSSMNAKNPLRFLRLPHTNTSLVLPDSLNVHPHGQSKTGSMNYCEKVEKEVSQGHRICEPFNKQNLKYFIVLFLIVSWGVTLRLALNRFQIPVPYSVLLLLSGLTFGILSRHFCKELHVYSAIARTAPEVILFVFLPVLIFESAFAMNSHVFWSRAPQIFLLGIPGTFLSVGLTTVFCYFVFFDYAWTIEKSTMFAAIISTTNPVAVAAILRSFKGNCEPLSVLIQGESLIKNGIGILVFEVMQSVVIAEDAFDLTHEWKGITFKFCQIAIGGPVFGYLAGVIASLCLKKVFNDPVAEITITVASAFLTYSVGNDVLGVSGIIATLVLGIKMSAERTSLSSGVDSQAGQFWTILAYVGNTVLFTLVGIVIGETGLNSVTWMDFGYLLVLYCALNLIRLTVLMVMTPILKRVGHGIQKNELLVLSWGDLRGAVATCLSLIVYKHSHFCVDGNMGPKFLFHTGGIVLLTLLINGTSSRLLLRILKVTQVTESGHEEMSQVVKQMCILRDNTIESLKKDAFLSGANWSVVLKRTEVTNPYESPELRKRNRKSTPGVVHKISNSSGKENPTFCISNNDIRDHETTEADLSTSVVDEITRDRVLKAFKLSFLRQFDEGLLTEDATQTLVNVIESHHGYDLVGHDLVRFFKQRQLFTKLSQYFQGLRNDEEVPPPVSPGSRIIRFFWKIATSNRFEILMYIVVILNMVPIIWNFVLRFQQDASVDSSQTLWTFFMINLGFTVIYFLEFLIKIIGVGIFGYFKNKWNWIDFIVLVIGVIEIGVTFAFTDESDMEGTKHALTYVRPLRLLRIIRVYKLLRPLAKWALITLDEVLSRHLYLAFDLGQGFLSAISEIETLLPQMIQNERKLGHWKRMLEQEKLIVLKEMENLQEIRPAISTALKTRQATRKILNELESNLSRLRKRGLLEERGIQVMKVLLEEKMKRLEHMPSRVAASNPEVMLANLPWAAGDPHLISFLQNNARLVTFSSGDTIAYVGDDPFGVYILVSGLVRAKYETKESVVHDVRTRGQLPNTDLFNDLTFSATQEDVFFSGATFGILGYLTELPVVNKLAADTAVTMYHIDFNDMTMASKLFESLDFNLWHAVGTQIAKVLLSSNLTWSKEEMIKRLSTSVVATMEVGDEVQVKPAVSHVILIYGQTMGNSSSHVYKAPCILPSTETHLHFRRGSVKEVKTKVLLISNSNAL